mmetsp:Transcript_18012/g.28726  ORF Transcript_18012/g.28726 Transcript_18012/m.28726 type:complete len:208 (+) Transcript_18012:125-748(+)
MEREEKSTHSTHCKHALIVMTCTCTAKSHRMRIEPADDQIGHSLFNAPVPLSVQLVVFLDILFDGAHILDIVQVYLVQLAVLQIMHILEYLQQELQIELADPAGMIGFDHSHVCKQTIDSIKRVQILHAWMLDEQMVAQRFVIHAVEFDICHARCPSHKRRDFALLTVDVDVVQCGVHQIDDHRHGLVADIGRKRAFHHDIRRRDRL